MQNCINKQIKEVLSNLKQNDQFIQQFKSINSTDKFIKAKLQEDLIARYSNGLLYALQETYDSKIYDSELDLKFGDLRDIYGNYYDLKIGESIFCGAISKRSLENFGNTKTDRHWYICVDNNFSHGYIINARKLLLNHIPYRKDIKTGKEFLGELDYKDSIML